MKVGQRWVRASGLQLWMRFGFRRFEAWEIWVWLMGTRVWLCKGLVELSSIRMGTFSQLGFEKIVIGQWAFE